MITVGCKCENSCSVPRLVVFSLLSDSSLSLWGDIQLSTAPWDITFDWSDHLWVCLDSQPEPVVGYCWKENKVRTDLPLSVYYHSPWPAWPTVVSDDTR